MATTCVFRRRAWRRAAFVLIIALAGCRRAADDDSASAAGSETQKPLAIVIIGGLITATLLVLVVLPALYLELAKRERSTVPRSADEFTRATALSRTSGQSEQSLVHANGQHPDSRPS